MENTTVFLGLHEFLERMREPSAAEIVKSIKSFIVSFSNNAPDPERDSNAVQEFLNNMDATFRSHPLWAGCSEEELDSVGEGLEKYLMAKLFTRVFALVPDDVKKDEQLSEKMALIQQFVQPENLDITPTFQNETSWLLAQKELHKVNMCKAPRDKLLCILNCCKVINNLLLNASIASDKNPPGADEFLPVLIYVTIKANPPQLHSNLRYIQRFRRQSRLAGEADYFFTNMLSAEEFISNINAKALSMDETEFDKSMESARSVLSGLELPEPDTLSTQSNQTTSYAPGASKTARLSPKKSELKTKTEPSMSNEEPSLSKIPSLSDLENKGASMLLKEDQMSRIFREYPYLFSRAGDLTINDVENLLNNYKQLVLKYICLSKGLSPTPAPNVQPETQTPAETAKSVEDKNNSELHKSQSSTDLSEDSVTL